MWKWNERTKWNTTANHQSYDLFWSEKRATIEMRDGRRARELIWIFKTVEHKKTGPIRPLVCGAHFDLQHHGLNKSSRINSIKIFAVGGQLRKNMPQWRSDCWRDNSRALQRGLGRFWELIVANDVRCDKIRCIFGGICLRGITIISASQQSPHLSHSSRQCCTN